MSITTMLRKYSKAFKHIEIHPKPWISLSNNPDSHQRSQTTHSFEIIKTCSSYTTDAMHSTARYIQTTQQQSQQQTTTTTTTTNTTRGQVQNRRHRTFHHHTDIMQIQTLFGTRPTSCNSWNLCKHLETMINHAKHKHMQAIQIINHCLAAGSNSG